MDFLFYYNKMEDQFKGHSRFVFHSGGVEDRKYNRVYRLKPGISFVILWDQTENEYLIRGIDGKKVDPPIENRASTILGEPFMWRHRQERDRFRRTKRKLQKMGIELIKLKFVYGCFRIDTELVQKKLASLNNQLQRKCPALSLRFGKGHELPGDIELFGFYSDTDTGAKETKNLFLWGEWLLCLYYEGNCVSSIKLNFVFDEKTEIVIESKTHDSYQRKKYNTILRVVLLLLAEYIVCKDDGDAPKVVQSLAINPISAWVLLNNFDVIIEGSSPVSFEEYRELTEAPSLKELIFGFYKKYDAEADLSLQIPLNHKNIAKALEMFKTLTHEDSKWGC